MSKNIVHLIDCMEFMKSVPDKYYELAIVDPPYGIGFDGDKFKKVHEKPCSTWRTRKPKGYIQKDWDSERPSQEYFNELYRISKNQIIWGGNYFSDLLYPSGSWIVWDKQVVMPTFSDGELAWCSINNSVKFVRLLWSGYRKCENTDRIHPTQKPVALYKWLLQNYAKPNDKIFDSHVGSGSIRIACHDMGFDFEGCEIDKDYWEAQEERYQEHAQQLDLFDPESIQESIYQGELL